MPSIDVFITISMHLGAVYTFLKKTVSLLLLISFSKNIETENTILFFLL